jgi:ferredoxin
MKKNSIKIKFKDEEKEYELRNGLGFQALGVKCELPIEYDCRKADCGICIISVLEGIENLSKPTPSEADFLKAMRADDNERLACQCQVLGDVSVEVIYS